MTDSEIGSLRADVNDLEVYLAKELGEIKTMLATEAQRCPYREDISRAQNNVKRLSDLETVVQNHRLETAKAGAVGGGVVALCGGALAAAFKIAGLL